MNPVFRLEKKYLILCLIGIGLIVFLILELTNKYSLTVALQGDPVITLEVGTEYKDPGAKARYKGSHLPFRNRKVKVTAAGSVDVNKLGTYTITYKASHRGLSSQKTRTVKVVDTQAPVITLKSDADNYTLPGAEYKEEGYTAKDNYDGDLTSSVEREEKDGVVTYTVTDSSGNVGKAERKIVYDDRTAPVITLDKTAASVYVGDTWEDSYSAKDDLDGDVTSSVKVDGKVDTSKEGTYVLKYTSTDAHGNTAQAERKVVVKALPQNDPENPKDKNKIIYLTFDDGPGQYTAQLLDILKKYNVKATFFVTGQFGYSNMISREAQEGHAVGVHSMTHDFKKIYASDTAYWEDFADMDMIIVKNTGRPASIMRFPGGSSNTISSFNPGFMTKLVKEAGERGLEYFDWNVSSGDAGETQDSNQVYQNIIDGVQQQAASVVLCHDIHPFTVNAMEKTIRWCLENGYTFEPITPGAVECHHPVNN